MQRQFTVLWRTFFAQFFTSENVRSDIQLRQTFVWVLAFLFVPGIVLLVQIFFDYQGIVALAIRRQNFDHLDDTLEWIAFVFITHSMVTIGFIAVFVWDALAFDRRDVMVLGPLPVRGAMVVSAKLAAMGTFLVGAALLVNVPTSIMFAFETANSLGGMTLVRHFAALLTATVMAAAFVFAAIVVIRAVLGLVAGARVAAACGAVLQFLFVVALLTFVILCPAVWDVPHRELINPTVTGWLPTSWFLGVFEKVRGSTRAYFMPLATRGLIWMVAVVGVAVVSSIVGFRRQMQVALTPSARAGAAPVRLLRAISRGLAGRSHGARATSDFILLTIFRNRSQQTPVAMNTAIGVAVAFAGVVQLRSLGPPGHPPVAILAIPLLVAYWMVVGLRAAAFVPSELPASWAFHVTPPRSTASDWAALRASMLTLVVPIALLLVGIVAPITGARIAAVHAIATMAVVAVLVEFAAITVDHVPFTRAYAPGHAKLRTRWPLYLLGMYVFAYWPARSVLTLMDRPRALATFVVSLALSIVALEVVGRRRITKPRATDDDDAPDELFRTKVLDLRAVAPSRN